MLKHPHEGPRHPDGESTDVRGRILSAARELFGSQGFERVSMRRIADRAGYSATTIYIHFENKKDLLFQITESILGDHLRRMRELARQEAEPRSRLSVMLSAWVDMGLADPDAYSVCFLRNSASVRGPEDFMPRDSVAQRLYDLFLRTIREVRGRGGKPAEEDVSVQSIWAMVHGLTAFLVAHPTYPWCEVDQLKKRVIGAAVGSLG